MTSPVRAPRPAPRTHPTAAPAEHVRPDLRIVREPRRRTRSGLIVGLATIVVFGALLAGAIAHSLLVSGQVHLDRVSADTRAQEQQLELDKLRLAELSSPVRITEAAKDLGLVEAPQDGGRWLSPGAEEPSGTSTTGPDSPSTDGSSADELAASTGEITPQP